MRVSAGALVGGVSGAGLAAAGPQQSTEVRKTRSYNPQMEYRRLGKTGLWVSAVCLGGHWKRINKIIGTAEVDACTAPKDNSQLGAADLVLNGAGAGEFWFATDCDDSVWTPRSRRTGVACRQAPALALVHIGFWGERSSGTPSPAGGGKKLRKKLTRVNSMC